MNGLNLTYNLDNSQLAFCLDTEEALCLLAPAGSGKSHSILCRCLLQANQADAKGENVRFLIITFTRAGRDELIDRIKTDSMFKALDGRVQINTLNGWGFNWLRLRTSTLMLSFIDNPHFVFTHIRSILKKYPHLNELLMENHNYHVRKKLINQFDYMKSLGFRHDKHNTLIAFRNHVQWLNNAGLRNHVMVFFEDMQELEIVDQANDDDIVIEQIFERFMAFWIEAVELLFEKNYISFEDQKYWTTILLEEELAQNWFTPEELRCHQIFVDEFQDINALDLNLLDLIAKSNKAKLCIVGDDDQAIFEWRGASPSFILNPNEYISSNYKTHVLEVNYRSPQNIVEHSKRLIQHNKLRVPKNVTSASMDNAQIDIISVPTVESSVDYVLSMVKDLLEDDKISKIALISRKRSQLIPYQMLFAGSDIPFYAAEDLNMLLSDAFNELKLLISAKAFYLELYDDVNVPIDLLINFCNKVKRFPLNKTEQCELKRYLFDEAPHSLFEALQAFFKYTGQLKGDNKGGAMTLEFYTAIHSFLETDSVSASIEWLSLNFKGLKKDYNKSQEDIFYADPPFLFLSAFAERYDSDFRAFYHDITKTIYTLAKIKPNHEKNDDYSWKRKIHLMTALRAKGKEFDVVVILDCNQDVWPSKFAINDQELEAERRLFYVAFTRTKKQVVMLVNEQMGNKATFPSPYIKEMGLDITEKIELSEVKEVSTNTEMEIPLTLRKAA